MNKKISFTMLLMLILLSGCGNFQKAKSPLIAEESNIQNGLISEKPNRITDLGNTGLIVISKDSNALPFVNQLANERNWSMITLNSTDAKQIRQRIIQSYKQKPFTFLLLLGNYNEIPLNNKTLLTNFLKKNNFFIKGKLLDQERNSLDSLYYSNVDNDKNIELAVGRLPFSDLQDLENYYSTKVSEKKINKINVITHSSFGIPQVQWLQAQLIRYKGLHFQMVNTVNEFNQNLENTDLLYVNSHGSSDKLYIGENYSKEKVPQLKNNQIIISESCSSGKELGPEFIKKGALAFVGYSFPASVYGLVFLEEPSQFKTIGEIIREANNFYILEQRINFMPRSMYYLIGDPSLKIDFETYPENTILLEKDSELEISLPPMMQYDFNFSKSLIRCMYLRRSYQFTSTPSILNLLKQNEPCYYQKCPSCEKEIFLKCNPNNGSNSLCKARSIPNCDYKYSVQYLESNLIDKTFYLYIIFRLDKNFKPGKIFEINGGHEVKLNNISVKSFDTEDNYYLVISEPNTNLIKDLRNGKAYKKRNLLIKSG